MKLDAVAGVPAALVGESNRRGVVVLLHGLGGSKSVQLAEAEQLAADGFVAVVLDAVGHGDRRYPDFEQRFSSGRGERSYFEAVAAGARELPAVVTELRRRLGLPVGACGISMGGATLFGAMAQGVALEAAVTIVASPRWRVVGESPHDRPERFGETPLLMMTAGQDTVVPSEAAHAFHRVLSDRFRPGHLILRHFPEEGHMFTPAAWAQATGAMVEWFERFLAPTH